MNTEQFFKARLLFVIDFCPHCQIWKQIIQRYNIKMPLEKRIRMIDCTKYYDFGIIEEPLFRVYKKYIQGKFPCLFFEGEKLDGANSKEEVEAWLYSRLFNDFIINEENKFLPSIKSRLMYEIPIN